MHGSKGPLFRSLCTQRIAEYGTRKCNSRSGYKKSMQDLQADIGAQSMSELHDSSNLVDTVTNNIESCAKSLKGKGRFYISLGFVTFINANLRRLKEEHI